MTPILDAFHVVIPSERAWLSADTNEWLRGYSVGPAGPFRLPKAGVWSRKEAGRLALTAEWPYGTRTAIVRRARVCACCGKHSYQAEIKEVDAGPPRQYRCDRHLGRNPCLVPGCGRTTEGKRPRLNSYICGPHWKLVPRRQKTVYNRIWRLQRKSGGWTDTLLARYWRIWPAIARTAIARSRGDVDLDIAEIEKMFGL